MIQKIFCISGDDCVSTEYVEEARVPKLYGERLRQNVIDTIESSNCKINM